MWMLPQLSMLWESAKIYYVEYMLTVCLLPEIITDSLCCWGCVLISSCTRSGPLVVVLVKGQFKGLELYKKNGEMFKNIHCGSSIMDLKSELSIFSLMHDVTKEFYYGFKKWAEYFFANAWCNKKSYIKSLWPSDAIQRWRSWSTLVQVMACCLMAPSHYLNQCWLITSEVLRWYSLGGNYTGNAQSINYLWYVWEKITLHQHIPGNNRLIVLNW